MSLSARSRVPPVTGNGLASLHGDCDEERIQDVRGRDTLGHRDAPRGSEVPQRVGVKQFSVVVQLLETTSGERLIRFAYTSDGSARRGPVTMRARDLERLRAALERAPVLQEALGL